MNVMGAGRSFCLPLQGYHQRCLLCLALIVGWVIISMSRAVFTSFFPHFLFYSYIISFSRIIVKSKMRLLPSKKVSRVEVFWLTSWTFRKYGFGTSRKHLITFLTFKFHFHNRSHLRLLGNISHLFKLHL